MNSFSLMVEMLKLKTEYQDTIKNNKFSVPKKYNILNTETANWCIEKLKVFNGNNEHLFSVICMCKKYIKYNDLGKIESNKILAIIEKNRGQ